MLRKLIHTILALTAGICSLNAQFVEIEITVPAGSSIFRGTPAGPGTSSSSAAAGALEWMGISLSENLELTVVLSFGPDVKSQAFFLNDGSTDLINAMPINGNRAVFPVSSKGRLSGSSGDKKGFTFWIGLPEGTNSFSVEYN